MAVHGFITDDRFEERWLRGDELAVVADWIGGVGLLSLGLFAFRNSCEGLLEGGACFHGLGVAHPLEALFPTRVAENIVKHESEIFVPWGRIRRPVG